jgi:hypothetical protein
VYISLVPSAIEIENQNFENRKRKKQKSENQKSEISKIANLERNFPLKENDRTTAIYDAFFARVRGAQTQKILGSIKCHMLYPLGDHLCFPFNVALCTL